MKWNNAIPGLVIGLAVWSTDAACPTLNIHDDWKKYFCTTLCDVDPIGPVTCSGLPECPPNTRAQQADPLPSSELPVDGYFLLGIKGKPGLYKSPLKTYSPVMIPGTDKYTNAKKPTTIHIVEVHKEGKWVLFTDRPHSDSSGGGIEWRQNVHLMKTDGTGHIELPNKFGTDYIFAVSWFYNSIMGEEIAILTYNYPTSTKPNIHAIKVEFKADGTAAFGTSRQIGKELGGALWGEFAAGGEFILYRERGVNGGEPVSVFTIPDSGRGMATKLNRYNGHFSHKTFNCGITISPDGKLGGWNTGRAYVNCITGGHHGFDVLPLRKNTDAILNPYDWYFRHGVFSWAPLNIAKADPDLHIYKWTTHPDYLATYDQQRRLGAFLVNWRTGKWYSLMPNTTATTSDIPAVYPNVAAHVQGGTGTNHALTQPRHGTLVNKAPHAARFDTMGRMVKGTAGLSRKDGLTMWQMVLNRNGKAIGAR